MSQSFASFREKQFPFLLMTPEQRAWMMQLDHPKGRTQNFDFDPEVKMEFTGTMQNARPNMDVVCKAICEMDSFLGIYRNAVNAGTGLGDPQFKLALGKLKCVHDELQKIKALQRHEKTLSRYIDSCVTLHDIYCKFNQTTAVSVPNPELISHEIPTNEGMDYHLSKSFYDRRSHKWIQRKVKNVDKEAEATEKKEAEKEMRESFSFSKFLEESELNTINRLGPDGDIMNRGEDAVYVKKAPRKLKTKQDDKRIQADPMSS